MAYENFAMATAQQFGNIPFTDFTRDLITNTFKALLDAHIMQMEEYADLVQNLTIGLSAYLNNTVDDVTLPEIKAFVESLALPSGEEATKMIDIIQDGYNFQQDSDAPVTAPANTGLPLPTTWAAVVGALAPAVSQLVDKIKDPNDIYKTTQAAAIQEAFIRKTAANIPNYNILYQSIAATIASNKYALLQNMVRMGLMRLVVDNGNITVRFTFESYESHETSSESENKEKEREKHVLKNRLSVGGLFGRKRVDKSKTLTVNTAKSFHRDTSGARVEIYASVSINFKTDYAPLSMG